MVQEHKFNLFEVVLTVNNFLRTSKISSKCSNRFSFPPQIKVQQYFKLLKEFNKFYKAVSFWSSLCLLVVR